MEIGVGALPSASAVAPRYSTWFPVPYKAPDVPPANGVTPTPVADGVVLEWDAVDLEGVVYVISRSESQDGPWTEIHRTTETRYVYSDGSGKTWWFQITPTVRGKVGTGAVVGVVPPATSKDLAEQQAKLAAEISARIQAIADEAAARAAGLAQAAQDLVAEALLRQQGVTEAMQAISAEAQARVDAILNEKLAREAAITQEQQLRQSADESLARAVSEVAAGSGTQFDSIKLWPFNQTTEGWTGNGAPTLVDGWLRPTNHANAPWVQSPVALAVDGSAYRFVKLRVKRVGTPAWGGFLQWITTTDQAWSTQKRAAIPEPAWDASGVATVDVQDVAWWPATVDAIRLQLGTEQSVSNYFLIDYIAVGRPQPGASVAVVQAETEARISADAAEAAQRNTLAVQIRGNYTGSDPLQLTSGLAYEELKARVAADSAQVQRISTMEARMPVGTGSLATAASVSALQEATATTTSALAQSITKINAALPAMIAQGSNMVLNGSWQSDKDVGWTYDPGATGTSWPATQGRAGGLCVRFDQGAIRQKAAYANGRTTMPTSPGKKYRYSCWYRSSPDFNGTAGNSKMRLANQNGELLGGVTAFAADKASWTYLSAIYAIPENTSITGLQLSILADNTAGTLWVDDVSLEEVTELLANAQAISDLSNKVTQHGETITSQAGLITALRSDVTDVAGRTAANTTALQQLTTRVTTAEDKIETTSQKITQLQAGVDGVNAKADANSTAIQGLTATVTQQGQKLEATAQDLTSLKTQVGDVNATAFNQLQTTVLQQGTTLDATAQDLTQLKTQVGDVNATAVNQLKTQVQQDGVKIDANAQAIHGLQVKVEGYPDAAVMQSMEASIDQLGGGNLLPNATFTSGLDGWPNYWAPEDTRGLTWWTSTSSQDAGVPIGSTALITAGTPDRAGSLLQWCNAITAEVGKWYMASAYASGNRYVQVALEFMDANGNSLGSSRSPEAGTPGGGQHLSSYSRHYVKMKAPPGTTRVWMFLITRWTSPVATFTRWVRPMLAEATESQGAPGPWSAGGMESMASWSINVRTDGKVGGLRLASTNGVSAFDVLADVFRVSSPSSGMRTEYSDGNWRVYDQNGRLRMRWGVVP
ncbi:hypothetical protein [uncultured Stenotrophomonas sp.]|uniref:hypothetical protein n=1 Tax=uncultured Stenotrophomonas sp. TaxID=165438 RepID=UPI0025E033BC|nr:hypothetical protein [uncultured Stenotrophomonas sp.]